MAFEEYWEDSDFLPPFFDSRKLKPSASQYVCWLDVMGSRSAMNRSMDVSANFVMKLHVATLRASKYLKSIDLYPMVDGVYACGPDLAEIFSFTKRVLLQCAVGFAFEDDPSHRFVIKGGLSFGPVVKKADFEECANALRDNPEYCRRILLGISLSQAFDREKEAPPFGLVMDDSVRAFGQIGNMGVVSGVYFRWWRWDRSAFDVVLIPLLRAELERYYQWCLSRSPVIRYPIEKIEEHRKLAHAYFSEAESWEP